MNLIVFVADDILTLQNNKTVIIGLYPDSKIRLQFTSATERNRLEKTAPAGFPIAIMVSGIDCPAGEYTLSMKLRFPDGSVPLSGDFKIVVSDTNSFNAILKTSLLFIWEAGTYFVSCNIHDTRTELPFEVIFQEPSK